jgi:hypothetical protein
MPRAIRTGTICLAFATWDGLMVLTPDKEEKMIPPLPLKKKYRSRNKMGRIITRRNSGF